MKWKFNKALGEIYDEETDEMIAELVNEEHGDKIASLPDLIVAAKDACLMIKEVDNSIRILLKDLKSEGRPILLSESERFAAIIDAILKAEGKI